MRIITEGDRAKAGKYIAWAKNKLKHYKRRAALFNRDVVTPPPFKFKDAKIYLKSVFGHDEIRIVGIGGGVVEVLFLVNGTDFLSYAAWVITNKQGEITLTPAYFDLSAHVNITTQIAIANLTIGQTPAVIQSNPGLTQHYYTPDTMWGKRIYIRMWPPHYAYLAYEHIYINGNSEIFPIVYGGRNGFGDDGEYNENLSFLNYKTVETDPLRLPEYICGARHNWTEDANGNILTNLGAWNIDEGQAQIRYTTKEGTQRGEPFYYDYDLNNTPMTIFQGKPVFNNLYAVISPTKIVGSKGVSSTASEKRWDYVFGDVVIEEIVQRVQGDEVWTPDFFRCGVQPLAYDNKNIDETFIFIYRYQTRYQKGSNPAIIDSWKKMEHTIAYRNNGGGLVKITPCSWKIGIGEELLEEAEDNNYFMFNPSCRITGKYITYSYSTYDFKRELDSVPINIPVWGDDEIDRFYTFNKRVMGVIDRATNIRTEFEVNNALLGFHADRFNPEIYSAIGIHRGTLN